MGLNGLNGLRMICLGIYRIRELRKNISLDVPLWAQYIRIKPLFLTDENMKKRFLEVPISILFIDVEAET